MATTRMGDHQKITGNGLNIIGDYNEINGNGNNIVGDYNEVNGNGNNVTGDYNKIKGTGNNYTGDYNTLNGKKSTKDMPKIGKSRTFSFEADVIGNVGNQGSVIVNTFGGPDGGLVTQVFRNAPGSRIGKTREREEKKKEEEEPQFIECPAKEEDVALPDDAPDGTPVCSICLSNQPVCVVLPCLHKCICCACARQITGEGTKERGQVACPICKGTVEKIGRVFE